MKPDPLGVPRDDFRVFILAWCVINGIANLFGRPTSVAVQAQLTGVFERVYGATLSLSAAAVLAGMFWLGDPRDGLVVKRAGYIGLTFAVGVYGGSSVARYSFGGVFIAGASLIFAALCARSAWVVHQRIRAAIEAADEP